MFKTSLLSILSTTCVNFDPLAQFDMVNTISFYKYPVTNLVVFTVIVFMLAEMCFLFANQSMFESLNFFNFIVNCVVRLINSILNDNAPVRKKQYFSIIFFLFIFVLSANMVGLLPFSWSITNSFVVTFYLAFTYFFAINLMAIWRNGWDYCSLFLPSGVPLALAPLIVIIEIVSYYSRVFSLSIRLFANISSGHALLKILTGFSWSILMSIFSKASVFNLAVVWVGFMFPWLIVTLIFFLEFLIAFLQSYVFVVLLAIYINDVVSNSH